MGTLPLGPSLLLSGGSGRIEGFVRDLQTGEAIAGATVLIRPCGIRWGSTSQGVREDWRPFYVTESDGAFFIDGLPDIRFQIEASASGYLPHAYSPLIELFGKGVRGPSAFDILRSHMSAWDEAWTEEFGEHEVIRHHFPKAKAGHSTRLVVLLRPGQVVRGHVRSKSGEPISGAVVETVKQSIKVERGLFEVIGMVTATTADRGEFEITAFPREELELGVSAKGFAKIHRKIALPPAEPVELVLEPGGRLSGTVATADGRIARRVRVLAFLPTVPESVVTDDSYDGRWTLEDTPPPPFTVIAWHGFAGAALAEVRDVSAELKLTLAPLAAVHGRIVDPSGAPVEDSLVWQVFQVTKPAQTLWFHDVGEAANSDSDGRFELQVLPNSDGKALVHFDYRSDPAWVDVRAEATLVISKEAAEDRARQREYRALLGNDEESSTTTVRTTPAQPPAPYPDLSPEEIEKRNRAWIELLKTAPPGERVQLISRLRDQACGTDMAHARPPSDRVDLLPVFEAGVENDDDDVRFWAISCIHYMNRPENLPLLIRYLQHSDPAIREYAITGVESLASHAGLKERAVEALIGALKRERQSWNVALGAACALAGLGEKINPRRFADALKVEGLDHRVAVKGLGITGSKESIALILDQFERADTWNAHQYPEALEAITGQKLGRHPGPWRAWLEANRASLPVQWT